jgi:glycosyltransferase involved in cell wall biosynthesis
VILAMLASRPCLSTGAEGVSDMITPQIGAIASPENDPDSMRALLERYLDDPERMQREGAAARVHAERTYAAPIVAKRIEELLDDAIARSSMQRSRRAPTSPSGQASS